MLYPIALGRWDAHSPQDTWGDSLSSDLPGAMGGEAGSVPWRRPAVRDFRLLKGGLLLLLRRRHGVRDDVGAMYRHPWRGVLWRGRVTYVAALDEPPLNPRPRVSEFLPAVVLNPATGESSQKGGEVHDVGNATSFVL